MKSKKLLRDIESLGYKFRLNQLENSVEANGQPMDDVTLSDIVIRLLNRGHAENKIIHGLNYLANQNAYHPIVDYLTRLSWDGSDRLTAFLGCFNSSQNEAAPDLDKKLIFRWLVNAVARVLGQRPGDSVRAQGKVIVFVGGQGIGKSTMSEWLCSGVGLEYYGEGAIDPENINSQRAMVGKWIWEVAELGAVTRKSDRESLKAFITMGAFTYKVPYAKYLITKPAMANLIGTLNPECGFLNDPTGNRRFWPVALESINWNYKKIDVNQLWAQIVHRYNMGASYELLPEERDALTVEHTKHQAENPLETFVQMFFTVEPGNEDLKCHTAAIINRLRTMGVKLPDNNRSAAREILEVMSTLGLSQPKNPIMIDGVQGRGWLGIAPK